MRRICFISTLLLFFLSLGLISKGQDISFSASAPKVVETGEQFRLTFQANGNISDISAPPLAQFRVLSGPSRSQSSSVQIINGNVTQSFTTTYTYVLAAKSPGKYTIAPVTATINKKQYKSNPVQIEVIKGNGQGGNQGGTNQGGNNQQQNNQKLDIDENDLFMRVVLNKNSVYQGEALVATVKIYRRIDNLKVDDITAPSFQGFYQEELEPNNAWHRENVNGQIYQVAESHKLLLFPQKTGTINIEPAKMECTVNILQGYRRTFFFNEPVYKSVQKTFYSPALTIQVYPLPPNAPEGFTGAVGSFDMNVSLENEQVKTNESVSLKVTVNGTGNFGLVSAPEVKLPKDIDVFDPNEVANLANNYNGTSGKKVYDYLLIPRYPGTFKIPAVKFAYFDLNTKTYKQITSDEFVLKVAKGEGDGQPQQIVSGYNKQDVERLGSDIRYIKTSPVSSIVGHKLLFGSWLHFTTYGVALLLFVVLVVITRKRIAKNADEKYVRKKKAVKMAGKRLKNALAAMQAGEKEKFYEELLKAVWGYYSDKLSIPVSDLSKEKVLAHFDQNHMDESTRAVFNEVVDQCEYARYAPATASEDLQAVYTKVVEVISGTEQLIKRK